MIRLMGGRIIDPASGRDEIADLLIDGDTLVERNGSTHVTEIDVSGYVVAPGFARSRRASLRP